METYRIVLQFPGADLHCVASTWNIKKWLFQKGNSEVHSIYVNTFIYHQYSTLLSGILLLLRVSGGYPYLYQQSPPCNCSPSLPPYHHSTTHYSPNCQGSSSSVLSRNSASARSAIHSRNSKPFGKGRSFVSRRKSIPKGRNRSASNASETYLQKVWYEIRCGRQCQYVCIVYIHYIHSMWKCTPYLAAWCKKKNSATNV